MRKRGHITIFLSMILLCVSCLLLSLVESARTAGARWFLQIAANSAMDSVFSQYHREVWENYRLFFLEHRDEKDLEERYQTYLSAYEEAENWYPMKLDNIQVEALWGLTEQGGKNLEKEILDYMAYGIWNLDFQPEAVTDLVEGLKEAGALKDVSAAYSSHTKEAFRLEEALEAIEESLQKQRMLEQEAMNCLADLNGPEFRNAANDYIREAKKIPKLIEVYEKRADILGEKLEQTKADYIDKQTEISQQVFDSLERELSQYQEYTNQDGVRRREVLSFISVTVGNIEISERAIDMAIDVERYIADWDEGEDDEDDEDELDEGALWEPVRALYSEIQIETLNLSHGIKDKEKQKWLERLKNLGSRELLKLVLPEGGEISSGIMDLNGYPSQYGVREATGTGLFDNLLVNEYCDTFFTDFLAEEKKEVLYELEYLIGGKESDQENLTIAVTKILMLREGLNLLYLLSDSEKRQEAQTLAAAIVGAAGIAPLVMITAFFIMVVWALGEALVDVKTMLEGGKAALVKSSSSWKLSLSGLLELGKNFRVAPEQGQSEGLSYPGYLKLLLFLMDSSEKYYRMMDVIQLNIRRKQQDFELSHCAYYVEISAAGWGKHIFFSIPFVENLTGGGSNSYPLMIKSRKAY